MKNENNLIPTHHFDYRNSLGENLDLKLEIDSKLDRINGLYFTGSLLERYANEINFLETNFKNISLDSVAEKFHLEKFKLSLPAMLILQFLREYLGIYSLNENNQTICSCFGFTVNDLKKQFGSNQDQFKTLGEIVATTKASAGCGGCLSILKEEYLKIALNQFRGHIKKRHFNEKGEWLHFKEMTYAKTLIAVDDLIKEWLQEKGLPANSVNITAAEGYVLSIKIENVPMPGITEKLSQLIFDRMGLLVLFQL